MTTDHGLGRLFAPDERDANHPVRALLPPALSTRPYRYWNAQGWWFNQLTRPICVGASLAMLLEDGPVTQGGVAPIFGPELIYAEAQQVDEWPGTGYAGTSVRAGMKVLQAHGFISGYKWATSLQEIVQTLLEVGPVVMGTNWYRGMMKTDEAGFVHVTGDIAGGHAYKLDGVNTTARVVRGKQSWGRDWGNNGFFYMGFADLERLLHEDGEAALAVEIRK